MVDDIRPGDTCVVTHDIVIKGIEAFNKGERILVEKVIPNAQRPEFKFVVSSVPLQQRFQLSDQDLVICRQGVSGPRIEKRNNKWLTSRRSTLFSKVSGPRIEKRNNKWIPVVVLVGIVLIVAVFVFQTNAHNKRKMEEVDQRVIVKTRECLRLYDAGIMTEKELCSEMPGLIDVSYDEGVTTYKFNFEAARRIARGDWD
ncbi:MAG: hypothetical protein L6427_12085 [Actinomycetia bacterium]|nr:hypothetical protein [Actinomycetes bacterium]